MNDRMWNWRLWVGFASAVVALVAYLALFLTSRSVFWPSLALVLLGGWLLLAGLLRAFREPQRYRGRIAGPILTLLTVVVVGVFGFASFSVFKHFPSARNAPQVGQSAPDFTLVDAAGNNVSLKQLLAAPVAKSGTALASKGVLVVFYRGYW